MERNGAAAKIALTATAASAAALLGFGWSAMVSETAGSVNPRRLAQLEGRTRGFYRGALRGNDASDANRALLSQKSQNPAKTRVTQRRAAGSNR